MSDELPAPIDSLSVYDGTPVKAPTPRTAKPKSGAEPKSDADPKRKGFVMEEDDGVLVIGFLGHRKYIKTSVHADKDQRMALAKRWLERFREAHAAGQKLSVKDEFLDGVGSSGSADPAVQPDGAEVPDEDLRCGRARLEEETSSRSCYTANSLNGSPVATSSPDAAPKSAAKGKNPMKATTGKTAMKAMKKAMKTMKAKKSA